VSRNNDSDTDILGLRTIDKSMSGDWLTDFPGLLEEVHNPMLFPDEQANQPKQMDQFGPLEDSNFAASMFSPWLGSETRSRLDMAVIQSATPMTAYTPALSAGSVSSHGSGINTPLLNRCAALSTRSPKPDEVDEDGENSESSEDIDTANRPTNHTGSRKSSVASHRDKRRKTVTMELRGVEPEQVQKILSCLLSSNPTVDVKIACSSTP
jgi:hypothetical protein